MNTTKEYEFAITTTVVLSVEAKTDKQARKKLTNALQEYFSETTITVDKKEAKLLSISDLD